MTSTTGPGAGSSTDRTGTRPAFRFHRRLWVAAGVLLALPAIGMQVTHKIDWGLDDFAVFGLMLAVLCLAIEGATNYLTALRWRIGAMTLAVLLFLTLWVHLAVDLLD